MDIKVQTEKEPCLLDLSSQNEREHCSKDFLKKVKSETITSDQDRDIHFKTEVEEAALISQFGSQDESEFISGDPIMECSDGTEIFEPKIEIKTEPNWVEPTTAENLCIYDDNIEDGTDEDICPPKSPRLYEDISSCTSDSLSNEDLGNDQSLNVRKDSSECESQERDGTVIYSIERSVDSETHDSGNTTKQDINKENCKSILSSEYRKVYKCDICEKCFKYSTHLKSHRLDHETKEANKFDTSEKDNNHLSSMQRQLIFEVRKPHKCNICSKAFTFLSKLKAHQFIHEDIKPYKCNICDKSFAHLQYLKTHKMIHDGKKPHKCSICEKAFTDISSFRRHKFIHKGIKPHKCNICNKAFIYLESLKKHNLIHEGIKPHQCHICVRAFTHLSSLKAHILIHEGKLHTCNICNRDFTKMSSLKMHIAIHEGIRSHKCDICNKAFTQPSSLKRHKLTHEGIKTHKCNICYRAFTDLSGLKKHKLIHEGIKSYKCNICDKAFTGSSNLKRHKLIHEDQ